MAEKEEFTDDQIKAFAEKLQSWGESLPEPERELFAYLVAGAAGSEDEEVSGYSIRGGAATFWGGLQRKMGIDSTPTGTTGGIRGGKELSTSEDDGNYFRTRPS